MCAEDIGKDCLDLEETNSAVINSGEGTEFCTLLFPYGR